MIKKSTQFKSSEVKAHAKGSSSFAKAAEPTFGFEGFLGNRYSEKR